MTQVNNYAVANGPRAEVRQGINAVLAALRDCNAGPTEPPNPVPNMLWIDNSGPNPIIKIRNTANTGWRFLDEVIGFSVIGLALANAVDDAAARAALGGGSNGSQLFTSTSAANSRSVIGLTVATQAEAEAGVGNNRSMTPLTTAQAINARVFGLTQTFTNAASVAFTLPNPAEFSSVEFDFDVVLVSGASALAFRTSDNGGTSYASGTGDYSAAFVGHTEADAGSPYGTTVQNFGLLSGGTGSVNVGSMRLQGFANTARFKVAQWENSIHAATSVYQTGHSRRLATNALTHVQFLAWGGNITGKITMRGLK